MKTLLLLSLLSQLNSEEWGIRETTEAKLLSFSYTEHQRVFLNNMPLRTAEEGPRIYRVRLEWSRRKADAMARAAGFDVWPDVDYSGIKYDFAQWDSKGPPDATKLYRSEINLRDPRYTVPYPTCRHEFRRAVSRYLTVNSDLAPVETALKQAKETSHFPTFIGTVWGLPFFCVARSYSRVDDFSPPCFDSTLILKEFK